MNLSNNNMPTTNKKRVVCFIEQNQLIEIEKRAIEENKSRSAIIREIIKNGR